MKFVVSLVALATAAALPAAAQPQAWPNRAVRVITPQPPGTGIDLTCRVFAQKMQEKWNQPVVVENRPGADGVTGVAAFASAGNDHTLLCSFGGPITISPFTSQIALPYNPATDLKPIAAIADFLQVFGASKTFGVADMASFRAKLAAEPGKHNWSATQGLPAMLFGAFLRATKLDMAFVPYSALAPALQDLGQGRIQAFATSYASLGPLFQSGEAIPLMVLNSARAPQLPNVPTARELGLPELTVVSFNGFFATKEMSADQIGRIAADIQEIGKDPEIAARFAQIGSMARTTTAAEFTKMIADQRATVEGILRATGELK